MKIITILALMLATFQSAEAESNPADWETICEKAKNTSVPKGDRPSKSEEVNLAQCDSEALYYGIGQAIDYKRARQCAFLEMEKKESGPVFGGSAILMMIYANGLGVQKNISLAEKFACDLSGAPAEMEGRIAHLENLRSDTEKTPFDLCDDITSGYMSGFCTKHSDRMVEVERDQKLKAILSKWSEGEKLKFKKLQEASNRFTEARVQNEVDQSGTLRGTFMIQEEAIQKEDFIQSLQKLEAKKAPKYSAAQNKEEDRKLNLLYQGIQKKEGASWGTITREGIKVTQRAWLGYRDAWVEFAKTKYPSYSSESISAWFTKKRNHMLKSLSKNS